MISGLELAFAIVPLVVSAAEHHQKAYRKLKTIASQKARDEELEDFLADLHDEVSLLGHTLRCMISDLTTLTEKQRERLLKLDREQWKQDDVSVALKTRLGGDAEMAFTDILGRLLKSLDEVVSEKSLRFIRSDVVSGWFLKIIPILTRLIEDRPAHQAFSRSLKDFVQTWKRARQFMTSALDSSSLPKRNAVTRISREFPNATRNWNALSTVIPLALLMKQRRALDGRHDLLRTGLVECPMMHTKGLLATGPALVRRLTKQGWAF